MRKGDLVDVIQVISLGAVDADGGGGASISNTTVPTLWNIFCRCYKPYSTSSVRSRTQIRLKKRKKFLTIRDEFTADEFHTDAFNVLAKA